MNIINAKLDSIYDVTIGSFVEINGVRGMVVKAEVEAPTGQAGWPTYTIQSFKDEEATLTVIKTDGNTVAYKPVTA